MSSSSLPLPSPRLSSVSIQTEDFDLSAEVAALRRDDAGVGAITTFVGTVRDRHAGQPDAGSISAMELEHYAGMTERSIEAMIDDAFRRFDIRGVRVIHRVGPLQIADQIVLVAVTSMHRGESFQACEFLMDYLKSEAPFWKKETTADGARWVDARVSDDAALKRWGIVSGNATGRLERDAADAGAGGGGGGGRLAGRVAALAGGLRLGFVVAGFPLGTLAVNVVGGFLIGLALVWFRLHPEATNSRLLVVTGFLGGLTTFSSFSGESLALLQSGNVPLALLHSAAHLLGALAAVALGWWLGRLVFGG